MKNPELLARGFLFTVSFAVFRIRAADTLLPFLFRFINIK